LASTAQTTTYTPLLPPTPDSTTPPAPAKAPNPNLQLSLSRHTPQSRPAPRPCTDFAHAILPFFYLFFDFTLDPGKEVLYYTHLTYTTAYGTMGFTPCGPLKSRQYRSFRAKSRNLALEYHPTPHLQERPPIRPCHSGLDPESRLLIASRAKQSLQSTSNKGDNTMTTESQIRANRKNAKSRRMGFSPC